MANPRLPRKEDDPTGLGPSRRRADKRVTKLMQKAARDIRELVARLPYDIVAGESSKALKSETRKASLVANRDFITNYVNSYKEEIDKEWFTKEQIANEAEMLVTNRQYSWKVDGFLMDQTTRTIRQILLDALTSGSNEWNNRWWMNAFIDPSYERGTLDSFASAQLITRGIDSPSTNLIAIMEADAQLQTPAYLSRLQLVHGRVFEEMHGIVGDTVAQLRRVLTDGMGRGLGIRDISGMINDRIGVGLSRARTIARTETNKAYTDAYMDESDELNKNLKDDDYSIRQMHVSALTDTTRRTHAERHGTIHTSIEQKKWWNSGSNRISCYCTVIDVLINLKTGESLQQPLIDRTRARGKEFFKIHSLSV